MRRAVRRYRLKHLNPSGTWPSGNPRLYYRPKGQKGIAMPDLPEDDPQFLAAYAEAAGAQPRAPVVSGTIAAAVEDYKGSDDFKRLAATTRDQRRRILDHVAERYGAGRLRDLRKEHVRADLSRFNGHAARNRLKAWRGLLAWLVEEDRLSADPSEGIKAKTSKSDGHIPWDGDQVEAYRAHWPIGMVERLAFELIYWTGARVSDAVRLGEGHVDRDGWVAFRQQKTGGDVWVPYARELPEFAEGMAGDLELLHAAIRARNERHMTFLTTRDGSARSVKAVSQWFAAKARAAGIKARTAHGLRKSRAIALVEADATTHQVAAWTGHESLKEIEHYAKRFDRKRALTRRNKNTEVPTSAVQFQNQAEKGAKSGG